MPRPLYEGTWSRRGYLPHFDGPEVTQFVTIRLASSIPNEVIQQWRSELCGLPRSKRSREMGRRIERYLDLGEGPTELAEPRIAEAVERSLLHYDGERYDVHAWVIMLNHAHAQLTPYRGFRLSDIVGDWKSVTAHRANAILGRKGSFWQAGYFDRVIRDERHFKQTVWYIHQNPVRTGLCETAEEYRWSSARLRPSFSECL